MNSLIVQNPPSSPQTNVSITSDNLLVAALSKFARLVIGFRPSDVEDSVAIKDLKQLESVCIAFNILPNGFSQDPSVTPSKWTTITYILYFSVMATNVIHLILLSCFDLPDEWILVLGDFLYGHKKRRFFWFFFLSATIVGETVAYYFIFSVKKGNVEPLKLYNVIYSTGFKSEVLSINQFYCKNFRFVTANLATQWVRIIFFIDISFALVLIFIVHSVSHLPQTAEQFIYTGFWLLITYLGFSLSINNVLLVASLLTIHLSYFFLKATHVARTVQELAFNTENRNKADYFLAYKATISEIIQFQNEISKFNAVVSSLAAFLYIGYSVVANFGAYTAFFVHIDNGFMDLFILGISIIAFTCNGMCSATNGVILTKMHTYCKNLKRVDRCFQLDVKSFIKGADLQDRLSRNDIAFTMGNILDFTNEMFVIYCIENACLIMMFLVNFQ